MTHNSAKADDDLIAMWNKASQKTQKDKRNARKAAASEHDLQVICVQRFRSGFPQYAENLFAIPNGGLRRKTTARMLKKEGVVSGVPDLMLALARNGKHGLWIEMKNGTSNNVTDNQRRVMFKLSLAGYECKVCRNEDEFVSIIQEYFGESENVCNFAE